MSDVLFMNPGQPTVTELIDRRYELEREKEALEREIADLTHDIAARLLQAGEKQAFGSQGIGYALTSTTRYDFGKAAYRYLEDKGLLGHFVAPPKITKGKLDALLKEEVLSYADMAAMEPFITVEQSPYSLRKIAEK